MECWAHAQEIIHGREHCQLAVQNQSLWCFFFYVNRWCYIIKVKFNLINKNVLKNCSETALKIVRKNVVSGEAQTRTNHAKIAVL